MSGSGSQSEGTPRPASGDQSVSVRFASPPGLWPRAQELRVEEGTLGAAVTAHAAASHAGTELTESLSWPGGASASWG